MTQSTPLSPTGRLPSRPTMQYVGSHRRSFSMPLPLTPKQREVLDSAVDGRVSVCGREFTVEMLYSIFKGENLPRDPAVCEALDINRGLLDVDYSRLEQRVLAHGGSQLPKGHYGQLFLKD
jgi:hypothetical protein